jgi:hypothetical protein
MVQLLKSTKDFELFGGATLDRLDSLQLSQLKSPTTQKTK